MLDYYAIKILSRREWLLSPQSILDLLNSLYREKTPSDHWKAMIWNTLNSVLLEFLEGSGLLLVTFLLDSVCKGRILQFVPHHIEVNHDYIVVLKYWYPLYWWDHSIRSRNCWMNRVNKNETYRNGKEWIASSRSII